MSWNPFSRHQAPKRNVISKTVEREFEEKVKKLEQLDETSRKLYKDVKRCTEANNALSKTESKMAQDLANSTLCQNEPEFKAIVDEWSQAVSRMEQHMQDMNNTNYKTVVEPMKKFTSLFPSVESAVRKRHQSLLEFQRCQAKMEKYQDRERTGPNIVKFEQAKKALAVAKDDFIQQHGILIEDMPKLYDRRIDYFHPSFQSLIKSQLLYYAEVKKIYTEVSTQLNPEANQCLSDSYDAQIDRQLAEIKSLSIVADD